LAAEINFFNFQSNRFNIFEDIKKNLEKWPKQSPLGRIGLSNIDISTNEKDSKILQLRR